MNDMSFPSPSPLDIWFSKKPTIGLMGEFSAGKSTLLNLLLNDDILRTRVTATNMPVIWLTYAEQTKAESLSRDGILQEFDIDTLDAQGAQNHLAIRLSLPCDILKTVDIIDTPGISDSRLQAGALEFLFPYLDCVVWCSAANQAWRQSEKAMWTSLPAPLHANSILALTRADTMRKKTDLQKVIRRCERDAAGLFMKVMPISAAVALEARAQGKGKPEPRKWAASHAPALFEQIEGMIDVISANCAARPEIDVPVITPPATPEPKPKAKAPAKAKAAPKVATKAKAGPKAKAKKPDAKAAKKAAPKQTNGVSDLMGQLCQLNRTSPSNERFFDELDHILNSFEADKSLSDGHKMVLTQALSTDWNETLPKTKLMAQLIRELNDFGNNTWYALDQTH